MEEDAEESTPTAEESTPLPDKSTQPNEEQSLMTIPPLHGRDAITTEFVYYCAILKELAPIISSDEDRLLVVPWIKKLIQPEYQTSLFREKRNRYLSKLVICLFNDEITGVFTRKPPRFALVDPTMLKIEQAPAAEWERDKMWHETLLELPDSFKPLQCTVHGSPDECKQDRQLNKILDYEFQLLLYLVRPYVALMPVEDRTRLAAWLQTLCSFQGKKQYCSSMRAIRNDYIMTMLGYAQDLRCAGPFLEYPPVDKLKPLNEASDEASKKFGFMNPAGPETTEFLRDQPLPEDGAFCYVALTGDLVASNM